MTKNIFYHDGGPMYDDGTHVEPSGWYFWTETQADYHGPFVTEGKAEAALEDYARSLRRTTVQEDDDSPFIDTLVGVEIMETLIDSSLDMSSLDISTPDTSSDFGGFDGGASGGGGADSSW